MYRLKITTRAQAEIKKYDTYSIKVDPDQDDKGTEINLCSFARPHMRAFHCSWMGFFTAFFIWFAIAPLLPEIKETLGLSKQQVWTSNICSVAGTIFMRFINGPMCDKYGARILMGVLLMCASIPCALTGLVNSAGEWWFFCHTFMKRNTSIRRAAIHTRDDVAYYFLHA